MKLKLKVEETELVIDVGQELNDLCWLALAACKMYGKLNYPSGNFLPVILRTIYPQIFHPRTKIKDFLDEFRSLFESKLKEGIYKDISEAIAINIEIYKPNMVLDQDQKDWFERAFGSKRNMTTVSFKFKYIGKFYSI